MAGVGSVSINGGAGSDTIYLNYGTNAATKSLATIQGGAGTDRLQSTTFVVAGVTASDTAWGTATTAGFSTDEVILQANFVYSAGDTMFFGSTGTYNC